MKIKSYKIILNVGKEDEKIKFFDRYTSNILNEILKSKSYVIFYYDNFFKKYIAFDSENVKNINNISERILKESEI